MVDMFFLPDASLVGEECCRDLNEARGGAGAGPP
jgi:hypothetical protein